MSSKTTAASWKSPTPRGGQAKLGVSALPLSTPTPTFRQLRDQTWKDGFGLTLSDSSAAARWGLFLCTISSIDRAPVLLKTV